MKCFKLETFTLLEIFQCNVEKYLLFLICFSYRRYLIPDQDVKTDNYYAICIMYYM